MRTYWREPPRQRGAQLGFFKKEKAAPKCCFTRKGDAFASLCCRYTRPLERSAGAACLRPTAPYRCKLCDVGERALLGPLARRRGVGQHGEKWCWQAAPDPCGRCGVTWRALRSGETYESVWASLCDFFDDPARWKYKRRSTVLGAWHAVKLARWEEHVAGCRKGRPYVDRRRMPLKERLACYAKILDLKPRKVPKRRAVTRAIVRRRASDDSDIPF